VGGDAEEIFEKTRDAVHNWPSFAKQAGLRDANIKKISQFHRCLLCAVAPQSPGFTGA
jgi:hypothetical protein